MVLESVQGTRYSDEHMFETRPEQGVDRWI